MRGGFRSSAGEAVARGARERRLIGVGAERFGEDAAMGVIESDLLDCGASAGEFCGVGSDQRGGFVKTGQSRTG
jgi:hypothetical protein